MQEKQKKNLTKLLKTSTLVLTLCSCSSMKKSISFGVGSGAAIGAASTVGMKSNNKGKDAMKGAAIGALVGGLASYLIHGGLNKRDKKIRKETLFNLDRYGVMSGPMSPQKSVNGITFPVDSEEFIPTHRKGNKVIEQHRIWNLSDSAKWQEGALKSKGKK